MSLPLWTMLKEATAQVHDEAENSSYVTTLTAGGYSAREVAIYLAQHHALYEAMERVQRERFGDHPLVASFLDSALDRSERLEADLHGLLGPQWRSLIADGEIPIIPATRHYIEQIESGDAEFILANHYVRYLGDLSGGQILHRLFSRAYEIPAESLSFYNFEQITKPKRYKDDYRRRLDEVADERLKRAIAAHAVRIFELNRAMFDGLAARAA